MGKLRKRGKLLKLAFIGFIMLHVTNVLVAQTSFTITQGTTREYQIDAQANITTYSWQVFNDANLSSLTGSADVTLTSLGAGRENEIEVTWNKLGTYYLMVSVFDADACINKMAYTFNVVANNLPVLADDSNSTIETNSVNDSQGSGNLLSNDTDPDGDALSVIQINGKTTSSVSGTYGTISWNSNGTYTYTPNSGLDSLYLGESVVENFTVTVSDGKGGNVNSTLAITINGANENPLASNDTNATIETAVITQSSVGGSGNLLNNDTDVDGDALSVSSIDGVPSSTGSITGTYGTLVWTGNGMYSYTPNSTLTSMRPGESVVETFTQTISDGKGGNATSTLTITINGENNNPVLADDSNSTVELDLAVVSIGNGDILSNDTDPDGDNLSVTKINGSTSNSITGTYGILTWNPDGTYTYTPNSNMDELLVGENVTENFTVTVSDGNGGEASSVLSITIKGANTVPVLTADTNSTIETTVITQSNGSGSLLANDKDADGTALVVSSINGSTTKTLTGTYGTLVWNTDGTYTYTPNAGLESLKAGDIRTEVFTYIASDGVNNVSSTLTITINGKNDAPVLANDTNATDETLVITESGSKSSGNLLSNDSDKEGESLSLSLMNGSSNGTAVGLYGSLSWYSNGSYTYVPNSSLESMKVSETLTEVFTYTAIDGSGGSSTASLTITINGLNAIPILVDDVNSTIKTLAISEVNGSGNLLSNDTDADADALTITSIEGVATSTGTLTGTYGTLTWTGSGTYTYTPNAGLDSLGSGESVVEIFTYRADDPFGGYDTAALTITISGDNDAPVLANDTNRTNESSPVTQSGANSSGNLLTNDTDKNGDALTITQFNGVPTSTGTIAGTYGTLSWTAGGNYTYTPNASLISMAAGESVVDVFTYTAIDGKGGSGTATLTVTVNGLNDAPVLANDTNSTIETTGITQADGSGSLLANDSDPNGDNLTVSKVNGVNTSIGVIAGTYGTLSWNVDGTYSYIPNSGLESLKATESVQEIFTYTVSDGLGGTGTATLSITINGKNALPVLANDSNSTTETIAVNESNGSGNILSNDTDLDGDVLVVASINGVSNPATDVTGTYGTLNWNADGTYIYTPNASMVSLAAGESAVETFTVTVSDGNGGLVTSTLSITINGTNAAPVANNDTNSTIETAVATQATGSGNLLLNDTDVDGDALSISQINGSTNKTIVATYGTLVWNTDGTYTYTPNNGLDSLAAGESVTETFTQTIIDGHGGSHTSTLSITINGANQAPVLANDVNSTIQIAVITQADGSGSLLSNDDDIDNNTLTVTQINGIPSSTGTLTGTHGTLTWLSDGTYVYTPNADMVNLLAGQSVQDIFTYTATDGTVSRTATLTITINGSNVAPVLADDTNSTIETEVITYNSAGSSGNIVANDTDANGDALTITQINGIPSSTGTVTGSYGTLAWLSNGRYTYTPNSSLSSLTASDVLSEVFTVTVSDGNGESGTSKLTITINGRNDLPVLADDTNSTIETTAVNQTDGSGNLLANDTDAEGAVLVVASINGVSNPSTDVTGTYGKLNWNSDGTYTYTPNSSMSSLAVGVSVVEEFTVIVSDGAGGTATSTLRITINGANAAPLAVNDTNSTIETAVVSNSSSNSSGTLLNNDSDIDGDALTISLMNGNATKSTSGTYGTLSWNNDGTYTYTPNASMASLAAGQSVQENYTYTVSDGNGGTATATLTITINGENAAPVLANDTNLTTETGTIKESDGSGNLLANDTDADGQTLTITNINGNSSGTLVSTYGTLVWNADGTYTYTPNSGLDSLAAGENVTEVFTYTATDGVVSKTATLSITIRGANTNPQLLADINATIKTKAVDEINGSGNLLSNDKDIDGDNLTVYSIGGELTGTTIGTYGKLVWNPDGTYTYIPNAAMANLTSSQVVYEVFSYVAIDGKGGSSNSTLTISISGENEAPVLANDTNSTIRSNSISETDGSGNLLANDTDPDNDPMTITSINGNTSGTLTGTYGTLTWTANGTYTYAPNAALDSLSSGESFTDVFTYTASDGAISSTATLSIKINGANGNPVLGDDANSTVELDLATVTKGNGDILSNDTDPDGDILSVSLVNGSSSNTIIGNYGTLTWNPDGTYTYTPNSNLDTLLVGENVVESFIITVIDGNGGSASSALTITIKGANSLPILTDDSNSTVELDLAVVSIGNGDILSNDRDPDGDILSISKINGSTNNTIVGTYGTLTWNPDGTYTYTPNTDMDTLLVGENVTENFTVTVSDGNGGEASSVLSITIKGANTIPVLTADTNSTIEIGVVDQNNGSGSLLANDKDADGTALSIININGNTTGTVVGTYGTLIWNADGTYTYTPNAGLESLKPGETFTEVFTYTASDGVNTASSTLTLTITGVNNNPVLSDDANSTVELDLATVTIGNGDILSNDTDPDGDVLSISLVNGSSSNTIIGTYGTLTWNPDGTYTYTPNSGLDSLLVGENVTESFTVTVIDGNGGSATSTLTITIKGANSLPVLTDDSNSTVEIDLAVVSKGNGDILSNDTDPDGDILNVSKINGSTNTTITGTYGTLTWNPDGTYTYTPNSDMDTLLVGENVVETFTVTVSDGNGGEATSVLSITIKGANTVPVLLADTNSTIETDVINQNNGSGSLLANDKDADGTALLVSSINGTNSGILVGTYGILVWTSDGNYTYTPNASLANLKSGESVIEVFTYTATDGVNNAISTLSITIRGANSNPVLGDDSNSTVELDLATVTKGNGDLLANDTDPDGDILSISLVNGSSSNSTIGTYGTLTWNPDGTYTYTPNSNLDTLLVGENVVESFVVTVIDGNGGSATSTLTITIKGANSLPVLTDDSNSTVELDLAVVSIGNGDILSNDTDPDGDILSISKVNGSTNNTIVGTYGTLTWNPDGTYTYTPNTDMDTLLVGENVTENFTVTVSDGNGGEATSNLSITIKGANTVPVLTADTNSTIEIGVIDQNSGSGSLLANDKDADGTALTIININGNTSGTLVGTYGTLVWNADGTYTYTPNADLDRLLPGEILTEVFTYTASDGVNTASSTLTLTITGINNSPVVVNDTNATIETNKVKESDGSGNLLANDTDPDGDKLTIISINEQLKFDTEGIYGSINWNKNGSYTYNPNAELDSLTEGEIVTEVFRVLVSDGNGGSTISTLTITITGIDINLPPVAAADAISIPEDSPVTQIDVLANDSDPNGDALIISILKAPLSGATVSVVDGKLVNYTPALNYNGKDYFVYQICDNGTPSLCDADTVFVTVTPVNDAPLAVDDIVTVALDVKDLSIDVQKNDSDVDGDLFSTSIVSQPISGGTVTVVDNKVIYNAPLGFVGIDTFTYQICDNGVPSLCSNANVIVKVIDQIDAIDDLLALNSGETGTVNLLENDLYIEQVVVTVIGQPTHGTYTIDETGTIHYTANADFSGTDSIKYVITNSSGSDTAIVLIQVNPIILFTTNTYCVEEVPYYSWEVKTTGITLSSIDLTLYDTNHELVDNLKGVALSGSKVWPGSTTGGALFNVPAILQTLNIEVEFVVNNTSQMLTSVLSVPDCHVNSITANWDAMTIYGRETNIDVLANDEDLDEGDIDTLSLKIVRNSEFTGPYHGEVIVNNDGTISYIPELGYIGLDSFMYEICDNYIERACDTAIVRLNVLFNDELTANTDRFSVYSGQLNQFNIAANDFDPEGMLDLSSIVILNNATHGTVLVNSDGTVDYQSATSFIGTDQFQYMICDQGIPKDCDTAWVYINVHENQCVTANWDDTITYVNETVVIEVLKNDFDFEGELDSTTLKVVSVLNFNGPYHGTAQVNAEGTISYTPNNLFAGIDSFIYSICDAGYPECCDTAVVYVQVINANIGVVATRDLASAASGQATVINILSNDYDTDGEIDTASIAIVKPASNGTAQIDFTSGTITYTPNAGFNGLDSLIYQICDNGPIVSCDTAIVYIQVSENLPPVAVDDVFEAQWGHNDRHTLSSNDYDPEGFLNLLSIKIITPPTSGGITVNSTTGNIRYMPDFCSTAIDSFTYVIYDKQGNVSNIATVIINITIDPEGDFDMDGVRDLAEDLNKDGNPCNDDTDNDGIPNFQDNDDDGDGILTINEDVVFRDGDPTNDDTDGDGIPNYLDADDDDDCILTIDEDLNGDGNSMNDDFDLDGIPNYLDEDDNDDGMISCDQMEDRDGDGVPDWKEHWHPKANDDEIRIGKEETVTLNLQQFIDNDSIQMDSLRFDIISTPVNGVLEVDYNNWTITYTPRFDFVGVDSFQYVICDYYGNNCDTATVVITVTDIIIIPEVFTPNNDNVNDFLIIQGLNRYSSNKFEVFNRWGNKVYEKNNYDGEWDGFANVSLVVGDRRLPVGTYYYILSYGKNNQIKRPGALFLER
ncbi:MAG: Ig-like domain-containing protein [Prolixibacteraceae bacterium]